MARKKQSEKASQAATDEQVEQETAQDVPAIKRWIGEIDQAKRNAKPYNEKVQKIVERYKDARAEESGKKKDRRYNVLWSVVQTMNPLVYSNPPQPFVSRRHNDNDPAARDASMLMQRSLAYCLEGDELNDACIDAREDYLLGSRGVIRNKYTPYFKLRASETKTYLEDDDEAPEGSEVKEDDKGSYYHKEYEDKVYEECDTEHILYSDFLHGAAAKWRHVPWCAFRVPMTRAELIKRFGEAGKLPPLTINCKDGKSQSDHNRNDDEAGMFAKAEVWEVWDKNTRKVRWLCPQVSSDFLDEVDDPLELRDFFPCPRPVYGTKTNESLEPTPDFCLWQDIANELDDTTLRISLLTESLRVVGFYDKSMGEHMKRLLKQTHENEMVPVENWAMFAEKGGLRSAIEWFPLDQVMLVLDKLTTQRAQLLAELYEVTGISDIVRGASDPRETARAQAIKGNFANKRLSERQNVFGRMVRESLEIQAQIICKHYSDDMIKLVSSAAQILVDANGKFDEGRFKRALMILRSDPLRRFRIKIDEKKLASADLAEDREQRSSFTASLSQLLQAALPVAQQYPAAGPFLKSIVLFATRGFDLARSEEQGLEEALDKLISTPVPQEQEATTTGAAPKSSEEIANDKLKIENEAKFKQEQLQIERERLELEKKKAADEHTFRMAQLNQKGQIAQQEQAIKRDDQQIDARTAVADHQLRREESARAHATEQQRMQHDARNAQHAQGMEERRFGRDVHNDKTQLMSAFNNNQRRVA